MRIHHDARRNVLVGDYGPMELPDSARQHLPMASARVRKNYLRRNATHADAQYRAGVPLEKLTALEWGAKTNYPHAPRHRRS